MSATTRVPVVRTIVLEPLDDNEGDVRSSVDIHRSEQSSISSRDQPRRACQQAVHKFWVKKGYKFGEQAIEHEYLSQVLYSRTNRIAIAVVLALYTIDVAIHVKMDFDSLLTESYVDCVVASCLETDTAVESHNIVCVWSVAIAH